MSNIYKIYQLMEFFTNKYSYKNVTLKRLIGPNEVWLTKDKNAKYNVIRISLSTLDQTFNDKERIDTHIGILSKVLRKDINFLDIHISKEEISSIDYANSICIDENFYSGIEVEDAFPGIKNIIHNVIDEEKELSDRLASINQGLRANSKYARAKLFNKININVTNIIVVLCTIAFIIKTILEYKGYSSSAAYVVVGADYKFFTLGLKQFYRLFTYAFVHSSVLHLVLNMYSLYVLGNLIERMYGTCKYVLILFVSIIIGALSNDITTGNTLIVGMSGGIYALFTIYVIEALRNGAYRNFTFVLLIALNIGINFSNNVAWQSHFGGAITGVIFYFMFKEGKLDKKMIALLIVVFGVLMFKYLSIKDIVPLYSGTDGEIVQIYSDIGFKTYANKLFDKIYTYYMYH